MADTAQTNALRIFHSDITPYEQPEFFLMRRSTMIIIFKVQV